MSKLSQTQRDTLNELTNEYPGQIISPHVLSCEVTLTDVDSQYTMPIMEDGTVPLKTEIRLNKNDLMFVTGFGLFIYQKSNVGYEGKGVLQTYPNQNGFTTAAGFTVTDLETVYKGKLRMQVGTTEFIPGLDTSVFRWVPTTQQSAGTNNTEWNENAGFFDVAAFYKLRGSDQILTTITVPVSPGLAMANIAPITNQLVLKHRGFIIKNGANLHSVKEKAEINRKRSGGN